MVAGEGRPERDGGRRCFLWCQLGRCVQWSRNRVLKRERRTRCEAYLPTLRQCLEVLFGYEKPLAINVTTHRGPHQDWRDWSTLADWWY